MRFFIWSGFSSLILAILFSIFQKGEIKNQITSITYTKNGVEKNGAALRPQLEQNFEADKVSPKAIQFKDRASLLNMKQSCESKSSQCSIYYSELESYYFKYSKLLKETDFASHSELIELLYNACLAGQHRQCTQSLQASIHFDDTIYKMTNNELERRCQSGGEESGYNSDCSFLAINAIGEPDLEKARHDAGTGCRKQSIHSCFILLAVENLLDDPIQAQATLAEICELHLRADLDKDFDDPQYLCNDVRANRLSASELDGKMHSLRVRFASSEYITLQTIYNLYP